MTWKRHIRTNLAHDLLLGITDPAPHPRGWVSQRRYPQPGSKHERVARIALARELRRRDEYFIGLVAAMIDPDTEHPAIEQSIQFIVSKDRRREPKVSVRRDLDIATFIHEWLSKQPNDGISASVEAAADHFGLASKIVWDAWAKFKPAPPKD